MTSAELKAAILSISGSMRAFAKEYGVEYQAIQRACKSSKPISFAVALIREILKSRPS